MAEDRNRESSEDECGNNRTSANKGKPVANDTGWRRTEECWPFQVPRIGDRYGCLSAETWTIVCRQHGQAGEN